jgi:thioredoxin 1
MADRTKRPLLLFFTSAQSGPGRRMESLLANLARKERDRLRVSRVDIDEHPDLVERLDVTEVPTLVLVSDHRPVARLEGRSSAPRIERMIGRHLDPSNQGNPAVVPSRSNG